MSVSLLTVWRAARARAVPFAGESAGYLVLLACEELATAPRGVVLSSVALLSDGSIRLSGKVPADDARAEQDLRRILAELLEVASAPGLALKRAASRAGAGTLRAFAAELSKALIPVNHAAARRALVRLYRETERAEAAGQLAPAPASGQVDASAPLEPVVPGPLEVAPASPPVPPVMTNAPHVERTVRIHTQPLRTAPPAAEPLANDVTEFALETLESKTRPETVAALRRAAEHVAPVLDEPELVQRRELVEQPEPSPSPETPRLGSLGAGGFHVLAPVSESTLESAELETTERVPPVAEIELGTAYDPEAGWPVELASAGAALPLEAERQSVAEPEVILASPLALSHLALAVAPVEDQRIHELPTLRPEAPPPEAALESYPGMAAEKSDVRELLSGFQVTSVGETNLRDELKWLAGVEGTPAPPAARRR